MEFCKIFRRPNYKTYWYLRNHTRLWADCLQRSHEQENRQNRQIWIKQPTFIDSLWQAQPKVEVLKFIFFFSLWEKTTSKNADARSAFIQSGTKSTNTAEQMSWLPFANFRSSSKRETLWNSCTCSQPFYCLSEIRPSSYSFRPPIFMGRSVFL